MSEMIKIELSGGVIYSPTWEAIASLNTKIAQAIGLIGPVAETGNNKQDKYNYADYDDVAAPVRKALAEVGLAHYVTMPGYTQESPGKGLRTNAHFEFILADGATGAMIVCQWASEAMDYGMMDKGINKCATIAQKQWLKRALLVSTKEEKENDTDSGKYEEERDAPPQQQKQSAPPTRPYSPETLRAGFQQKLKGDAGEYPSNGLRGMAVGALNALFEIAGIERGESIQLRHILTGYLIGKESSLPKDDTPGWTGAECKVLLEWSQTKSETGKVPHPMAVQEAKQIIEMLDEAEKYAQEEAMQEQAAMRGVA